MAELDYLDAQQTLIGSMLLEPSIVGEITATVKADAFTNPDARRAFEALRAMYLDGAAIDPATVRARMGGKGDGAYLLQLMDRTPTAANWREYLEIFRRADRMRRIQSVAVRLCDRGVTVEDAAPLVAELNALMVDRPDVDSMTMEQGIVDFYAEMERTPEYLPWGLPSLDNGDKALTVEAGDFVVIGGYASDGKTAFALATAYHQAKTRRVGFFSLETKNSKLFSRIFGRVAQVSNQRIRHRTLTPEDWELFHLKTDEVKGRSLTLIRASGWTVADIRAYALAKNFDVIYVDYLTLIRDEGRDEFHKATNISKALHELAQTTGKTVVALSQLSRPEGARGKKSTAPTLASLRNSGQIEQDADVVMLLYREKPEDLRSRRILNVAKNKEGLTGYFGLRFKGELQAFAEDNAPVDIKHTEPEARQTSFLKLPGSEFVPLTEEETKDLPF